MASRPQGQTSLPINPSITAAVQVGSKTTPSPTPNMTTLCQTKQQTKQASNRNDNTVTNYSETQQTTTDQLPYDVHDINQFPSLGIRLHNTINYNTARPISKVMTNNNM